MATESTQDTTAEAVVKAAQAPAKAAAEVATAAKQAPKADKAAPAKRGRKAATARRGRKPAAKTATPTRTPRPARRAPRAAAATAAATIERTNTVTNDFNQMFAGLGIPGADKFQNLFGDAGVRGQELVSRTQKATGEVTDLAKANVEALVEAGRIATAGVRAIGEDVLASSRDGLEQASTAVKTLAEAKTPAEFLQLQSDLVRASFDRFVSESSKLTEQVVKLAGEAIQPISNRASVNAERVNELMA